MLLLFFFLLIWSRPRVKTVVGGGWVGLEMHA